MADPKILETAVADYIASLTKQEFEALVTETRDPEEKEKTVAPDDSATIANRMFNK